MSTPTALKYHQREFAFDPLAAVLQYGLHIKEGIIRDIDVPFAPYHIDKDGLPMDAWEYWMQYVFEPRNTLKYHQGHAQALADLLDAIWKVNRFTQHGSEQWKQRIIEYHTILKRLELELELIDEIKKKEIIS